MSIIRSALNFIDGVLDLFGFGDRYSEYEKNHTQAYQQMSLTENQNRYGFLMDELPEKPTRKKSCDGCGNSDLEYTVKGDFDVCDYCGKKYERQTVTTEYYTQDGKLYDYDEKPTPPPPPKNSNPSVLCKC